MDEVKRDSIESLLSSAFASVLRPKTAVYAAVPVTSGPRLWKLAKELGISELSEVRRVAPERLEKEVLRPNCAAAAQFVGGARIRHKLVIDPSRLVIPEWSQKQYWRFWEYIILEYVAAVLLSPEWSYSRGCVYECIFAVRNSIPVLSEQDEVLTIQELREIASGAIRERDSLGIKARFLDEFVSATAEITPKSRKQPGRSSV